MTHARAHYYWCDDPAGCDKETGFGADDHEVWMQARADGWTRTLDGQHFCPAHRDD